MRVLAFPSNKHFKSVIAIGRFNFDMVRVYNETLDGKEHYFPLHHSIQKETDSIPVFGQKFNCTMVYYTDQNNEIIGRPIKYAIPLVKFIKLK